MTISTDTPRSSYTGDGTLDTYDFGFLIQDEADLKVMVDGEELTLTTDYTVDGVGDPDGGSIVLVAGELENGSELVMTPGNTSFTQEVNLRDQGRLSLAIVEDALDRAVIRDQILLDATQRSLRVAESVDPADVSLELPEPESLKLLRWNEAADAIENVSAADVLDDTVTGNFVVDEFDSGDFTAGSTTQLTLSQAPGTANNCDVYFNGVYQNKTEWSLDDTTLTFNSAIPIGVTSVSVKQAHAREINVPADGSVGSAQIADSAVRAVHMDDAAVPTRVLEDGAVDLDKLAAEVLAKLLPVGAILAYGGNVAPDANWKLCDGTSLLRASYPTLFALIGTTYGSADGTHFNLPDLRGRSPIGAGAGSGLTNRALGATVGEETHTLTSGEMPSHHHSGLYTASGAGGAIGFAESNGVAANTGDTGGGGAHNNMQPSLAVGFIIKVL